MVVCASGDCSIVVVWSLLSFVCTGDSGIGLGIEAAGLDGRCTEGWLIGMLRTEPFRDAVSLSTEGVLGRGGVARTVEARRTTPPMRAHLDFAGAGLLMTREEWKSAVREGKDSDELLRAPYYQVNARCFH